MKKVNSFIFKVLFSLHFNYILFTIECYNKSQGIVLLRVYDRSMSQNSCARTDIVLRCGSRTRNKQQQSSSTNHVEEKQDILSSSLSSGLSSTSMSLGLKTEDRNLSVCQNKIEEFLFFETLN